MRYLLPAIAALLMLSANSCNDHKNNEEKAVIVNDIELAEIPVQDTAGYPVKAETAEHQNRKDPSQILKPNADWDKKLIKTSTLNIEVENYRKYNDDIHQLVKKWEAYISTEQENSSEYKIENTVTIKIPVQYFDEAVQQLSTGGGKLLVKQVNSQDVTSEYFDTKARMEAKKRIRMRYLDMLQKAKNMEEILQVEREINALQEQIEAGEGRVNYLNHSAAYSTIQLTFFQVLDVRAVDPESPGYGKRILLAMSNGLKWVGELIILLVTLWPVWIGLALAIWVIKRITGMRGRTT